MNNTTDQVLKALRDNVENEARPGWGIVYLDNARPAGMSAHQFAGHLSALTERGLYEAYDDGENNGFFGNVKMN